MTFRRPKTNRQHNIGQDLELDLDLDRVRELETENALLRAKVSELHHRLAAPAAACSGDEPAGRRSAGWDVADDGSADDGSVEAFEAFLAVSDPKLDRVHRFLLGRGA